MFITKFMKTPLVYKKKPCSPHKMPTEEDFSHFTIPVFK